MVEWRAERHSILIGKEDNWGESQVSWPRLTRLDKRRRPKVEEGGKRDGIKNAQTKRYRIATAAALQTDEKKWAVHQRGKKKKSVGWSHDKWTFWWSTRISSGRKKCCIPCPPTLDAARRTEKATSQQHNGLRSKMPLTEKMENIWQTISYSSIKEKKKVHLFFVWRLDVFASEFFARLLDRMECALARCF